MNKIGQVVIVVGIIFVVYLLMLVTMPILADSVSTANITMHATSNMSNYPGTAETVIATPWVLWFVPGVIGMVAIVTILRKP